MSLDETLKTIYRTICFGTALESECLGYLGRKYQITKCQVIQPFFFKKRVFDFLGLVEFLGVYFESISY